MTAATGSPLARVRGLYDTFRDLVHELAKFGITGLACAVLDIGLFNVFRHVGIGPLTSKGLSTTVAAVVSYFINRHWAFDARARTGLGRELVLFIVLSAVGLGIAEACLGVSHYLLGLTSTLDDNISANGFGLVLGTLWRYLSFRKWVFLPVEAPLRADHDAAVGAVV